MEVGTLLVDGFARVREATRAAVDGLDVARLTARVGERANTIGWLAWHVARVQDAQVADAFGTEQVWTAEGWDARFDLPFPPRATGYGHGPEDVAAVRADAGLLLAHLDAVHARTVHLVERLRPGDLDRVVDPSWDPPVTLGVRLVSIIADDLQHAGQAQYVRGLLEASDD